MPHAPTKKVKIRKLDILEIMKRHREITTGELVAMMGLTHTQVWYTLKLLEKEGYVKGIKRGHIVFWRVLR